MALVIDFGVAEVFNPKAGRHKLGIDEIVQDIEQEIINISLTQGPQGASGATGATGPQGPQGVAGGGTPSYAAMARYGGF